MKVLSTTQSASSVDLTFNRKLTFNLHPDDSKEGSKSQYQREYDNQCFISYPQDASILQFIDGPQSEIIAGRGGMIIST